MPPGERVTRCAPAAQRRGDPLPGTAAPASRYVLVERPGAWGRNALTGSGLDPAVARELVARCRALDARLLLVRRAHRDPDAPRRAAIVDARVGQERTWWRTFEDDRELLDLDPGRPDGELSAGQVLLVCTHGRRDPCCARRGWPVALALAAAFPELLWQCSHVGGDRFAANLVVLPHGLYYGHVTPESALAIVGEHRRGRVVLESLRGRSLYPPAVQAAQHAARLALDERAIDALPPLRVIEEPPTVLVELAHAHGVVRATLERTESEPLPSLTCRAASPSRIVEHRLLHLELP